MFFGFLGELDFWVYFGMALEFLGEVPRFLGMLQDFFWRNFLDWGRQVYEFLGEHFWFFLRKFLDSEECFQIFGGTFVDFGRKFLDFGEYFRIFCREIFWLFRGTVMDFLGKDPQSLSLLGFLGVSFWTFRGPFHDFWGKCF